MGWEEVLGIWVGPASPFPFPFPFPFGRVCWDWGMGRPVLNMLLKSRSREEEDPFGWFEGGGKGRVRGSAMTGARNTCQSQIQEESKEMRIKGKGIWEAYWSCH
jgi:hypothetical protein